MKSETLEQLDKSGADAIKTAQEYGTQIVEFVKEQAPELIEEIILFKRVEYSLYMCIGIVLGIISYKLTRMAPPILKKYAPYDELHEFCTAFAIIVSIIFTSIAGCITMSINLTTLCQVWFAPRLYLLEYFSDLVSR